MAEPTTVRWLIETEHVKVGTSQPGLVIVTTEDGEQTVTALHWEQVLDVTPRLRGGVVWSDEGAVPRSGVVEIGE